MEEKALTKKRVLIYIAFAFGLSWLIALVIYLTGGLINSKELIPGTGVVYAILLLMFYMLMPALANVFTRMITKEGWKEAYFRPHFKTGWKFWVAPWLLIPLFIVAGMVVYFLVFPAQADYTMMSHFSALGVADQLPQWFTPLLYTAVQLGAVLLVSPIANAIPTFGEEFGWRGYLQPKLLKLMPARAAVVLTGVIWGLWHAPIILMGHNYGLEYFGAPILGPLMMIYFCVVAGVFIGWASLKARSVWPAVIGHSVLNGAAALPMLFLAGEPYPLIGPYVSGLIGGVFFAIATVIILTSPKGLTVPEAAAEIPAEIITEA